MTHPQPSPALSADVVAQMVADRAAGTPGPWHADGPVWNQIIWTDSENRLCFMAHSNGLNDDRDIANYRRATRLPDLEAAYLTLVAQLAERDAELARVTREAEIHRASAVDNYEKWSTATARIAALTEALARSTEGWANAIELGLIPERHRNTAFILRDAGFAALTTDKEPTT